MKVRSLRRSARKCVQLASRLDDIVVHWRIRASARMKSFGHYLEAQVLRKPRKHCPVCGFWLDEFLPFGTVPRKGAKCGNCGALERHRLVWLFFQRRTDLFDGKEKAMLHVAPEPCFDQRLTRMLRGVYITADLNDPRADVKMDISAIPYPPETFDVFYCSHVLEYVPNDRQALAEIFRVLKLGGWAVIMFSITANKTIEDPTVVDPAKRCVLYGDERFRKYGLDCIDRAREAGFTVTVIRVRDLVSEAEIVRMGLTPASGEVVFCSKPRAR
jgi:SAM-dependent methyltransferase